MKNVCEAGVMTSLQRYYEMVGHNMCHAEECGACWSGAEDENRKKWESSTNIERLSKYGRSIKGRGNINALEWTR